MLCKAFFMVLKVVHVGLGRAFQEAGPAANPLRFVFRLFLVHVEECAKRGTLIFEQLLGFEVRLI